MKKLICPECGAEFYLEDSKAAYYEETGGEGDYESDFDGDYLCPKCTVENVISNYLSDQDADLIYDFSGRDEDYDFRRIE